MDDALINFFGNITVWINHALSTSTTHAGYDKIHVYMALLKAFVELVIPHESILQLVNDIASYVAYLSSNAPTIAEVTPQPLKMTPHHPRRPESHAIKPSPRAALNTVLSPRAIRAMAKEVAEQASAQSPQITKRRPKKIIELSDHEEAILELALFYDEAATELEPTASRRSKKTRQMFTQQWLLLPKDKRTTILKKIKTRIRKEALFGGHTATSSSPSGVPAVELSRYLSLIMLCLQETTRHISVFSAQIAAFTWTTLCEEPLQLTEKILDQVLVVHREAADELQKLRESRRQVQEAIAISEREIQRLQDQNVLSLSVWQLENQEMAMLEREEEWHGHCKLLLLKSLVALQAEVYQATWLQVRSDPPVQSEDGVANTPTQIAYHRLPTGAALLHRQLRARVMYLTHLGLLCRSFLHLHEKKGLREVMELTSTYPRRVDSPPPSPTQPLASTVEMCDTLVGPSTPTHNHSSSAMEHISNSELLTLKDINNALRAIEQLYVCCGGSGDHPTDDLSGRLPSSALGHDASTQFPAVRSEHDPTTGSYPFVRSLSYSTMAATPSTSAPPFLPVGSTITSHQSPTARRRNAEIGVANIPIGSGRRLSSASKSQPGDATNASAPQPLIRLGKTIHKLPRHIRDVLISPLLEVDPFPADDKASITESLAIPEILAIIQWLYNSVVEASFMPWGSRTRDSHSSNATAIPLSRLLGKCWKSEQFVAFAHAAFVGHADDDVKQGERLFITFLASIQLLFSGLGAALNPTTGGSGPSHAMEKIYFFARMTRLFNLEAHDKLTKNRLPAHAFPVFFYCLHVLQHVCIAKKHIEAGGLSIDVWTAVGVNSHSTASEKKPTAAATSPTRTRDPSRSNVAKNTQSIIPPATTRFVLLESVKTLLMYLLESTSPDASLVVDECVTFLTDRSTVAKVSLLSPTLPGAYEINHGVAIDQPADAPQVVNGELGDALILPVDFAVQAIINAWLWQHKALLDRLSVAMRAADLEASGEISFDEFKHVLLVGSAAPTAALAHSQITMGQLTQIYSSMLAEVPHGRGVRWQALLVVVADEIDLLNTSDKLANTDLRAIQHTLLHARAVPVSPWVMNASYRGGDTATLRKVWELNHKTMRDNFALTLQADAALEGINLWQSGLRRLAHVEKLIVDGKRSSKPPHSRSRRRRSSIIVAALAANHPGTAASPRYPQEEEEVAMTKDELDVAWRALYYLQVDHTHAHHIADHVRVKQQRSAKHPSTTTTITTGSPTRLQPRTPEPLR